MPITARLRDARDHVFEKMEPVVFFGAALCVIAFCLLGGFYTETADTLFHEIQLRISAWFGWYYVLVTTGFVVFALWAMLSHFGRVRLGPPESRPEFGYVSWFAMLFSAGMGTGIVFWGVAEPLKHLSEPPPFTGAGAGTPEAGRDAMRYTYFHWGIHPWAIYIIFGIAIAYYHFRHGLPLAPRAILYPLIGRWSYGITGHLVDILCTVGTLLGVSTSLGLGAMQINSGASEFFDIPHSKSVQVSIIALITLVATISVVSGIHAGIRRLSQLNLILAAILMLFVFIAGPTIYVLETFVATLGGYLQQLPAMSLWIDFARDSDWQAQWTLFYWGWWISWSPFVGVFVARISRGRTIREFVVCVLLVPSIGTFFWLSVFGGTALNMELPGDGGLMKPIEENVAVSLHVLLRHMPWADVSMMLATLVIIIFFITSSDSGSLVDDMVTSGGHPNPPRIQRVFWACSEGAVAATLLIVGGLRAIQNASISLGFLMSVLLVIACISLVKSARSEYRRTLGYR